VTAQLVEDLDRAVESALSTMRSAVERDWQVPARDLRWTCWETLEHVADDLFSYAGQIANPRTGSSDYVPFVYHSHRDGGPELTIRSQGYAGNAGLLEVLETCASLLSAVLGAAPPDRRGWHPYGVSDAGGFAAMGTVETLVHVYDVAVPLGLAWEPADDLVQRALDRLFPDAPGDKEPWPTLLWATGRAPLGDRARLEGWRWDSTVR
jgi:Mycothiol maleylpyruvate isomerase N-terminal domain